MLAADSAWNCTGCKKKVQAVKRLTLYNLPSVLIITIKRFISYGNLADKVTKPVCFQPTLDMAPYALNATEGTVFDLVGIVNHQGNMNGGHYTADVKGSVDGQWFSFSDETVQAASTCQQGTPKYGLAYILFYTKRYRQ